MFRMKEIEKIVYFVRHGQSADNIAPIFQSVNSPLTEEGKRQAGVIAKRAASIPFDVLISSPLPRAKETAEFISTSTGKAIEFLDTLVESIKPTGLEGKPFTDAEADALWKQWRESQSDPALRVGDGENYSDLIARADAVLEYLYNRPEETLMVVTHGYFLRTIMIRVMLGDSLSPGNFKAFQSRANTENTGISVIKYNATYFGTSWKLWIYNDHAHLGEYERSKTDSR
jgi:broad specificity phosphatase PhoE